MSRYNRWSETALGALAHTSAVFFDVFIIEYYLFTWTRPMWLKFKSSDIRDRIFYFEDYNLIQKLLAICTSAFFTVFNFIGAWELYGDTAICKLTKFALISVCALHVMMWMFVIIEHYTYHSAYIDKKTHDKYCTLSFISVLTWIWLSLPFILSTFGFAATCDQCVAKKRDNGTDCDDCYKAFMWIYEAIWFFISFVILYVCCSPSHSMTNRVAGAIFGWFTLVGMTVIPVMMSKCAVEDK